jgi:hypothetical protein
MILPRFHGARVVALISRRDPGGEALSDGLELFGWARVPSRCGQRVKR